MRKLYSFIAFFSVGLIFSQTILSQPETVSRTVTDPQEIRMIPGFSASSSVANPFVARIGASAEAPTSPTDSNAGVGNPSGEVNPIAGTSFHDTQGNIEVNGGGQLQFTLPIALPPGVKSVAPQINLVYTSGSGNGIAGYGWNLSGITSITRMSKTIERDGEVKGIQLDNTDYFSFNGQRLVLKSGSYGGDGAEYVTEKYSNVRIKSFGKFDSYIPVFSGPRYWEVTFEDGSQAWYGIVKESDINALTPVEYNIVKWMDSQGNYITYSYQTSQNDNSFNIFTGELTLGGSYNTSVISKIEWGGNEKLNKSHFNEIVFSYSQRDIKEQTYVKGIQFIQDKLLSNVIVNTNAQKFKKYEINYKKLGTNYQFVDNIIEKNSQDQSANAVTFENQTDNITSPTTFAQNSRFDDIYGEDIISGDFNGDGKLDFIKDKTLMLNRLDNTSNFYTIDYNGRAVSKGLNLFNGIISSKNLLYTFDNEILRAYLFNGNSLEEVYSKLIDFSQFPEINSLDGYSNIYGNGNLVVNNSNFKFIEGDFDGDGTSEFIISILKDVYEEIIGNDWNGYPEVQGATAIGSEVFDFYFDPRSGILKKLNIPVSEYSLMKSYKPPILIDFDGDGKTDILSLSDAARIYSLDRTKNFVNSANITNKISREGLLTADFNGDGKTDVMSPIKDGSSDWKLYMSTGVDFKEFYYSNLFLYHPVNQGPPRKNRNTQRTYATPDLNKDGKSDFVIFESQVWFRDGWTDWNNPDSSYGFNYLRNEGVDATGKPIFANVYHIDPVELNMEGETTNYSKYGEHYIPLFGNFRIAQLNTDFAIIHKTKLITWDLGNKLNKISKIKSITQGGVKTDIEYAPLTSTGNIYKSYYDTNPLPYPYVNITENVNYDVVSKLTQGARKQDFRYRDMIGHLQGKGMLGFRQSARSTFYADGYEPTKVWSGSEMNPLTEALPLKDWSIKTNDENSIFPSDISLNNTQLLSYKDYQYKIDKLLNGNVVTTYSDADKPRIVTAINPYITTSKDFQRDIKTVHTVVNYDNLYLPTKSTTSVNDGFAITTSEVGYNSPNTEIGSNYAIGKPLWKTETMQVYGDTKGGKEEYEYNGSLLTKKKTYNSDNSQYIEESYIYDGFGNVIQKTIKNPFNNDQVQSATTKSQYDDKGRFVIKKIDNLGLETNITYNDWGLVFTQTDPLNNTLTNTYDAWGKLLTSKTNLGGTTTYIYEKLSNGDAKVIEYSPDGDQKITYTNNLGQNYKSTVKGFANGSYISSEVVFDILGRKIKESEPYFEGAGASKWNVTEYDDYSRPIKLTAFTGKIIETSYSGRTVTATETNANNRFKTQVYDPIGNLSSAKDKGGTITYRYNAAGDNIESKYGTNSVTTKYDNWGRKSEFNDPSNGIYKYEYNGYGQLIHTISPKGHKYYQYNALGQLYHQTENSNDGTSTNKNITFEYDGQGRIVKKYGTSKGEAYSSYVNYDANGRVISSGEEGNGRNYLRKGVIYDDKGRITSYEKGLYSSGVYTKVNIENVYSPWDGEMYQLKDKASGKILWELTEANAKGSVLKAKFGGTIVENAYDTNNFLTYINHKNATNGNMVLYVGYSFNAIKNELNSRTTGGSLNILESFTYDDNNRLISWTNPKTGQQSTNVYDAQGRIRENDQVGTIKFDDATKIYQPTGATLNANGQQNYSNDLIQKISYNENNDPVFIDGIKGDVGFDYGLTAMRQRVTYGGDFGEGNTGRFTKYYSEDGSYEVTVDNTTGKEKHTLYIGGDPYASSITFIKNYTEASGSYKFLHKDYLGSILAITDEAGNTIEQRHFDAWGNLTLFKVNGIDVDPKLFNEKSLIDRGYTSHEYFAEVGIIHMNGRLYDPLLRRFLNADENIQDPQNTQNYNKYAYVINNPLLYNDPTGEVMGWDDALIAIGVAIFTSIATDYYLNRPVNIGNMFQSVVMSLMSAGIADGIGGIFTTATGEATSVASALGKTETIIARAGAHAISQGAMSLMQGGNFWSGALAGAFASVSGDLLGNWLDKNPSKFLHSDGFAMMTGAVSGGIGSVLGGGNFWMGAVQGLMVTTFNYIKHRAGEVVKIYDDDGDYVGKVKIKTYRTANYEDGSKGTIIEMTFKSSSGKYQSYQWIQTVWSNDAYNGIIELRTFNDPPLGHEGHDSSPYYWNKIAQAKYFDKKAGTYYFGDAPYRERNTTLKYDIYFRAEVSLVGINNSGAHELHTFKWGFNYYYNNNHFINMPLQTIPYNGRYKWLK